MDAKDGSPHADRGRPVLRPGRMNPRAVGVVGALVSAGASAAAVHEWFGRSRAELGGLSPRAWLASGRGDAPILDLARQDAEALRSSG